MTEYHFAHDSKSGTLYYVSPRLYNAIKERDVKPEETLCNCSYVNNTAVVRYETDNTVWFDVEFGNVDFHLIESLQTLVNNFNSTEDDFDDLKDKNE